MGQADGTAAKSLWQPDGRTGDQGGLALGIRAELILFPAGIFDHIDFHFEMSSVTSFCLFTSSNFQVQTSNNKNNLTLKEDFLFSTAFQHHQFY